MEIKPYTHTVISAAEAAELVLCADKTLSSVSCSLPDGRAVEVEVAEKNTVNLLSCGIPSLVHIDGFAQGTNAAAFIADVEIIPRHYFELEELRAFGDGTDDFSGKTDDELRAKREKATEVFERAANRSFVPRMGVQRTFGESFVQLDHCDVYAIDSADAMLVSDCQAVIDGASAGSCESLVYTYGASFMPAAVKDAVLTLAAYYLRAQATPDRATGEATDAGFIRFTIAGRDGATGLPEIDAIAEQFGRKRYGVV